MSGDHRNDLRHLYQLACPKCGPAETLHIVITCTAVLDSNGTTDDFGEHDWDDSSECLCPECEHATTVGGFRTDNPDADCANITNPNEGAPS